MQQFKNILLDINPEESEAKATVALEKAIALAKKNGSKLTLMSVFKEPAGLFSESLAPELLTNAIEDYQEWLADLIKEYDDLDINTVVDDGVRYLQVIRQVLTNKHDLVITTSDENSGIRKHLFGTNAMNLMRKCPCPVWVVKRDQAQSYKRILAAVDPAEDATKEDSLNAIILATAAGMARTENAELHIVHVRDIMNRQYVRRMKKQDVDELIARMQTQYDKRMDALLTQADFSEIQHQVHQLEGNPVIRIPELVKSKDIDLLVMGTVCRTGISGFLIGNTAEEVLEQVNCSVLTLKPEGFITPVSPE